ncbi:conserved hypothetical protein [Burkholderia pseudomallei Pakistan 9]|nr:conserved hypothetical protein [Burkholderia pseudomallei Pakistan 9]
MALNRPASATRAGAAAHIALRPPTPESAHIETIAVGHARIALAKRREAACEATRVRR